MMKAQTNIVTYAGNSGKETFYDVLQISDGTFLVCGYAENLNWIDVNVPRVQLTNTGNIHNAQGTNRYGFILHLSSDLQQILEVVHFPQGAVEDVRFMKTTNVPYTTTGDLFISGNTSDTYNNDGGYFLARLDNNFLNGVPTSLVWSRNVWASAGMKEYQPWDVSNNGEVCYVSGEPFGYNWSALYWLDQNGTRKVVNNWRNHWLTAGGEWHGSPATAAPGGINAVSFSGIVLKSWGRCELRSWNANDYNATFPDGNGGTRKGAWPLDVLYNGPCDNANPVSDGPGYTQYSPEACCPVYGGTCIAIDRRNNNLYIGMNFKSYAVPESSPDFEPAIIAMDATGNMRWWNRLYHEITPSNDTVRSLPDQYIDALAIDYANDRLAVGARCHGNNTENFWEGNNIAANPSAYGFQNRFTGTFGNIHESWLGKLRLGDGTLTNSTYMAELFEGTGGLGTPHPDPNLDGWPDPNTGWPDVNTTRLAKNNMKVSSDGSVCVLAVGRRTITTKNAYQKMVKPYYGGHSCWNNFVRVYDSDFHRPLYSSLVVGQWDTLTQTGGDNTDLYGVYKTSQGVVCVGRQKGDVNGLPVGNDLPIINVTPWGASTPQNESAILVYYTAENLLNPNDSVVTDIRSPMAQGNQGKMEVYPNPSTGWVSVDFSNPFEATWNWNYSVIDVTGRNVAQGVMNGLQVDLTQLGAGTYFLQVYGNEKFYVERVVKK